MYWLHSVPRRVYSLKEAKRRLSRALLRARDDRRHRILDNPRMRQHLAQRQAVLGLLAKQAPDQIGRRRRDARGDLEVDGRDALVGARVAGQVLERRRADEELRR